MFRVSAALTAALLISVAATPAFAQSDAPFVPAPYPKSGAIVAQQQQPQLTEEQKRLVEEEIKRREEERKRLEEEQRRRAADEQKAKDDEKQKQEEEKKKKDEEEKKEKEKANKPEPELNIPVRFFVWTAVFGALGAATSILSAGPERDLRDPAKHQQGFTTWWHFTRAYWGGFISKGFYAASGAMGGYAGYKTQGAVRDYLTAKAGMAQKEGVTNEAFATSDAPSVPLSVEEEPPLLLSPFGIQLRF